MAVGYYSGASDGNNLAWHGFTLRDGAMTELRHPEVPGATVLHGINDAETIVGVYTPGQNQDDAATFTFASNRFSRFDCFESSEGPPPPPAET